MADFRDYVMEECKRQWKECQEEEYGKWEDQTDEERKEYYNDMYNHLLPRKTETENG